MNMRHLRGFLLAVLCTAGYQAEVNAQDWIYKTRAGDTLWDLCLEYTNKDNCWLILGNYNQINHVKQIPVGTEIRIPQSWLIALPVVGQVIGVEGEVLYREKAGEVMIPLVTGQSLVLGSTVVTGQGSVRISLNDNSTILVRHNSELNLNSLSTAEDPGQSSELDLKRGGIEIEVEPDSATRFEVKTPSAIASVRGTQYRMTLLDDPKNPTRTEVISGAVSVKGVSEATVPAGFGIMARQDEPLGELRALLEPPQFKSASIESPLPVQVVWSSDPKAVAWQIDLMVGNKNSVPVSSYRSLESELRITDVATGCYQLVVRGIDIDGFQGLESQLPLCVLPPAPVEILEEKADRYWLHTLMATVFFIFVLF